MLHRLHRISATIICAFLFIHLINHLFIFGGTQSHIEFMDAFRPIYRNLIAESILILCVLIQVSSGVYFVWLRRGRYVNSMKKIQIFSGLYLAFFLLNHVSAVMYGRFIAQLDTNIYFGIAGFHHSPFHFFFIPYYFLAVVAVFFHIAAAFEWLSRKRIANPLRKNLTLVIMIMGTILSCFLILAFTGTFDEITIPYEYNKLYQ